MKVSVHTKDQAKPVIYESAVNAYFKDSVYCIKISATTVHKYPIMNIWRIVEHHESKIEWINK